MIQRDEGIAMADEQAVEKGDPTSKDRVPNEVDGINYIRGIVEEVIRQVLPGHESDRITSAAASSAQGAADLSAIEVELQSTRQELEQLRAEKLLQDRDIFLKEQVRALGVRNIELAFRAVRDDIARGSDGEWIASVNGETIPAAQFLKQFVSRNPELVPARMISGGGVPAKIDEVREECDLDHIRPGMDPASMRRAREAVVRIIAQSKRTL